MTAMPYPDQPPTGGPSAPQQQPPAGPAQRPPLRRSTTDSVIAGVCGGLAEHTGVEGMLWRVGFIALALVGPGVPVYLLLWLLVPAGSGGGQAAAQLPFVDRLRKGLTPAR